MQRAYFQVFAFSLLALSGFAAVAPAQNTPKATAPPSGKPRPGAGKSVLKSSKTAPVANQATGKETPPAAPVETPITVTVRATSEVPGTVFTLGEIADITGSDKEMITRLTVVEIGASPLPGLSRTIFPGDVQVHLRASRLESKRVEMILPPAIRISRAGHDIPMDDLVKAALLAGQEAIKTVSNATLEPVRSGDKLTVPAGKVQLLAGAWRGTPESGTIFVPISVTVDNKPIQTVEVALRVRRKTMVLVARRQIEPHTLLTADDVALAPTDLPPGFTDPITEAKEAVGKRTLRRLLSDAPIAATALETPPAVAFNAKITIEYIFGPLRITAPGLARQSGAIGETIRIYATDTRKDLTAVIVDSHTVRIADSADTGDPIK